MHYVIIRDDDTNALTPVQCLERLYRPFLERGLAVNLAVIPSVATDVTMADGQPEGFLPQGNGASPPTVPMGNNRELVRYLLDNSGYKVVQHGCHHRYMEFERPGRPEVAGLLDRGTELLQAAGFPKPQTFVAPYDRLSGASLREVTRRFPILSTGWYELRRLPCAWWPQYAVKKLRQTPHWQVGRTLLLSHPGCLLSYHRTYSTMLGGITHYVNTQRLTVLVTHWWEYFRGGQPDEPFIEFLHETCSYLATHPDVQVISFSDLLSGDIPLN